ncbi:MAG: type II secretion system F family protein [Lachnospiraceae bacterium]|jgi:type IV pilus assembly protein PilC|nr:type II secretion system F family protein [Lachnospiraceae bacterium]
MGEISKKPLKDRELASFCEQMAMMLKAGISSLEGISILKESLTDSEGRAILEEVYEELEMSGDLCGAFTKSGVFPQYFLNLAQIGERAGRLDEVFSSLAVYYERQDSLSKNIKSAVTYPCVMIGMMLAVILVLVIRVMPIFSRVYGQLGTEMSGVSRSIMNMGTWLSRYSLGILVFSVLLVAVALYLCMTKNGKKHLRGLGRRLPFTKGIYEATALSRFADGMSITLKSGLDSDEGLELSGRLTDSPVLREKIEECRKKTAEGTELGAAFKEAGIFSGLHARMVNVGILSGSLDQVMERVAEQYALEADERISRTVSRLEPTLVAIMSILVGMILLSVMLPLMGIMSGIG